MAYLLTAYLLNPIDVWTGVLPAERWIAEAVEYAWYWEIQLERYGDWIPPASHPSPTYLTHPLFF